MTKTLDNRAKSDHAMTLIQRCFSVSKAELCIGEIPVRSIVEKYGTPLFIYDQGILEQTFSRLRATYPPEFEIYYSIKANPNRAFLKYFLERDCGLEVASGGELFQAMKAGCPPERIIFAGPGKTTAELREAVQSNIREIHIESLTEAKRIARISRETQRCVRISLRINPSAETQGGAMRMGGMPSPFGIDEESLADVLDWVLGESTLELTGVHLFSGTQILDHSVLLRQYRKAVELGRRVAQRKGQPIKTIDVGGGLGIPYFEHERQLELPPLLDGLSKMITEVRQEPLLDGTRFIVEPGRYLVGEAGLYVTRVNDVKISKGERFLILDGGMHHHLAASGNLGQTIKRNFPVALINKLGHPAAETCHVVGPLCTPLDILARRVVLPAAEVGDLVGVFQSGAYGRTSSPLGFLSHPTPPEVWVEAGTHRLVRRRGEYDDLLKDQPRKTSEPKAL